MSEMACDHRSCFYCDRVVGAAHEHDHFPVPAVAGGKQVVPACLTCHELKDRITLEHWDLTELFKAWAGMPPVARILMAKGLRLAFQTRVMVESASFSALPASEPLT